ncbi:MAG: hypothetical protein K6C05_10900 [Anaerovibrio sp.]|uniref:hypothetical protein n=1 Tax=Anaerovibrio sp. TaxID=1872532 RepID=UPI0025F77A44|nr:hypothetical protein [Anaerovibrio sp.]MCR5177335.1 hypothetical protein [Anaerovibrio sp.]
MKNSKKLLALTLSTAFSLNIAAVASAEPSPEQLDALRAEIKELRQVLKVEKAKHKYQKAKDIERGKEWNIHGDVRTRYAKVDHEDVLTQRFRLSIDHPVGDTMRFVGRWAVMNNNEYGLSTQYAKSLFRWNNANVYDSNKTYPDFSAADNNWISDAYIDMYRVCGSTLTIGRFGHTFGATGFWSDADASGGIDGVKASFDFRGGKDNLTVGYANFSPAQDYPKYVTGGTSATYASGANAAPYYFSKGIGDALFITGKKQIDDQSTIYASWLHQYRTANKNSSLMGSELTGTTSVINGNWDGAKHDIWGIGFKHDFNSNLTLLGDYMNNRCFNAHQDAVYLSLRYKQADITKHGTFGLNLDYRRIGAPYTRDNKKGTEYFSILAGNRLSSDMTLVEDNAKGFVFGFQWVPGKNILIEGRQAIGTKYTDTGNKAPDYSSLSISTKF